MSSAKKYLECFSVVVFFPHLLLPFKLFLGFLYLLIFSFCHLIILYRIHIIVAISWVIESRVHLLGMLYYGKFFMIGEIFLMLKEILQRAYFYIKTEFKGLNLNAQ